MLVKPERINGEMLPGQRYIHTYVRRETKNPDQMYTTATEIEELTVKIAKILH